MEKINIAELLKDSPQGMELDCTIFDTKVIYQGLNKRIPTHPIVVQTEHGFEFELTQYGQTHNIVGSKCVIFPKGKTTWEGFVPFVEGDVIYTDNFIAILSHIEENGIVWYHCYYCINTKKIKPKRDFGIGNINYDEFRLATEEEKEKLFDAIKAKGYRWNAKTKTLEVLPKFKVGDKVIVKGFEKMGEDEVICVFKTYDGDIKFKTKNQLDTHYFMEDNLIKVGESNKKENMEEKGDKAKAPVLTGEDYSGKRFGYKIPNGYEFDCIKNNEIILTPKQTEYPKTYEECCKILGISRHDVEIDLPQPYQQTMFNLFKLHICRNAYWKVAGEQMGLDKPWNPDWTNTNSNKYCIYNVGNEIKKQPMLEVRHFLAFPTAEMRDAFYENFKVLIEECNELL